MPESGATPAPPEWSMVSGDGAAAEGGASQSRRAQLHERVCAWMQRWREPGNRRWCPAKKPTRRRTKTRLGSVNGGDFGGSSAAAFDRAVHVALPPDAGVLAGEEEAPAGLREPRAQRWIECRIEIRVAAARQRVVLPDDLARRRASSARLPPEPVERIGHSRARLRAPRLPASRRWRRRRRAATRMPGAAALFLVAVPHRTDRQRRAESASQPRPPPEALRELQQHDAIAQPAIRPRDENAAAVPEALLADTGAGARLRIGAPRSARSGTATRNNAAPGILSLLAGGGAATPRRQSWRKKGRGTGACARVARLGAGGARWRGVNSSGSRNRCRAAGTRTSLRVRPALRAWLARPCGRSSSPASTPASSGRAT